MDTDGKQTPTPPNLPTTVSLKALNDELEKTTKLLEQFPDSFKAQEILAVVREFQRRWATSSDLEIEL